MELTEGILKAIDSSFHQEYNGKSNYIVKYRGKQMYGNGVRVFRNKGAAKTFVTKFVRNIFWHGHYWQSCSDNIFSMTGYRVDYRGTIELINPIGNVSEVNTRIRKVIPAIVNALLDEKIITIEEIS